MDGSDTKGPMVRFYTLKNMHTVRPVVGKGIAGSFPRHIHHSLCVGIVDRGVRCIETCSGARYTAGPGEMFVLNPGQAHACMCGHSAGTPPSKHAGHDYRVLSLEPGLLRDALSSEGRGEGGDLHFDRVTFRDTGLARAMDAFFDALRTSRQGMVPERVLNDVLERLVTSHASTPIRPLTIPSDRGALVRVREYLDVHCDENVRLKDLTDVAGVSRFYLQRQFSAHMGVSPRGYLLQRRTARAASLLDQGMEPADVAVTVGFVDQSHLTRTFKRYVGITPGRFQTSQNDTRVGHQSYKVHIATRKQQ